MYNILTLNSISEQGLKKFSRDYNCSATCTDPHGILVRSALVDKPQKYKNLLAIGRAGAGTNNINIDECNKLGVAVFNSPGANANAVNELVLGCLFLCSRNIIDGVNWVKEHSHKENFVELTEKKKKRFKGSEIKNKKLGIIGLGAIGTLVANSACALGMKVFGYDPFISIKSAWNLCRLIKKVDSLENLFSKCDYISVHVPLNDSTKNMINAQLLSVAKPGAKILNFSRGEIINANDMINAIKSGKISNYVTDFPLPQFLDYNQIIAIPHLGASTQEAEDNCAAMVSEQLINFLETGITKNSVNFPDMDLPRSTPTRLCIFSKNVPDVMSKVLDIISKQNINIENMQSRSRGNFTYTVIDVDRMVDESTQNLIKCSRGIIRVRILT